MIQRNPLQYFPHFLILQITFQDFRFYINRNGSYKITRIFLSNFQSWNIMTSPSNPPHLIDPYKNRQASIFRTKIGHFKHIDKTF